jgi:hypothetical protein
MPVVQRHTPNSAPRAPTNYTGGIRGLFCEAKSGYKPTARLYLVVCTTCWRLLADGTGEGAWVAGGGMGAGWAGPPDLQAQFNPDRLRRQDKARVAPPQQMPIPSQSRRFCQCTFPLNNNIRVSQRIYIRRERLHWLTNEAVSQRISFQFPQRLHRLTNEAVFGRYGQENYSTKTVHRLRNARLRPVCKSQKEGEKSCNRKAASKYLCTHKKQGGR